MCSLATVGLLSGPCSLARVFAPRFFPAPPRGEFDFTVACNHSLQEADSGTDKSNPRHQHQADGQEITTYLRGWLGYFDDCQTPSVLQSLESWLRCRLRAVVWQQWQRGRTRYRELRKRGVGKELAATTAGSCHGPWRIANSPALTAALPNAYFTSLGPPAMVRGISSTRRTAGCGPACPMVWQRRAGARSPYADFLCALFL